MRTIDRFFRALFVALAVGLGWGIRGDFGHMVGAMYPGACLGLAFAYISGQKQLFKWMPILGAVGGLLIGIGGHMSYGMLHGYAQAAPDAGPAGYEWINYVYGFFTLFLQGGAWGVFAGAAIGLLLEDERVQFSEWAAGAVTALVSGWLIYYFVTQPWPGLVLRPIVSDATYQTLNSYWPGFHINPGRSDAAIGYTGAAIGLFIWLACSGRKYGLRGAALAYLGWGLGMSGGRLLGNYTNSLAWGIFDAGLASKESFSLNHWNVMEVSVGVIGGFIFAFGMLGKQAPEQPQREGYPLLSFYSIIYVLALIPLLHYLGRIDAEQVKEWAAALSQMSYSDTEKMASGKLLMGIRIVTGMGSFAALIWLLAHFSNRYRLAWFPVIFLSLVMLLFQNINAQYFMYDRGETNLFSIPLPGFLWIVWHTPDKAPLFNMHDMFWVLFLLMALLVFVYQIFGGPKPFVVDQERMRHVPWLRYAVTGLVMFFLILVGGYVTNGPDWQHSQTIKSGNTRWPHWAWNHKVGDKPVTLDIALKAWQEGKSVEDYLKEQEPPAPPAPAVAPPAEPQLAPQPEPQPALQPETSQATPTTPAPEPAPATPPTVEPAPSESAAPQSAPPSEPAQPETPSPAPATPDQAPA